MDELSSPCCLPFDLMIGDCHECGCFCVSLNLVLSFIFRLQFLHFRIVILEVDSSIVLVLKLMTSTVVDCFGVLFLCASLPCPLSFLSILQAPIPTFYDVTPIGRITNRFSQDLDLGVSQFPLLALLASMFASIV